MTSHSFPTRRSSDLEQLFAAHALTRDPRLRERLIVLHLGLVASLARRLSREREQIEDLIQVGYIGLINAIDRYDHSRGFKFCTFAVPTIVGEMRRYLRDKSKIIRVPRHLQEKRTAVDRAAEELAQRLERLPTVAEIAAEIDLDPDDIALLREQRIDSPLSLDRFLEASDGTECALAVECIGDDDEELLRIEDRFVVNRALESLTSRERDILYLLFYVELSQAEIGERLNISQMHVSRLARTALNRLREELRDSA
jgi:RNA polymerase sigma-B factor